MVAADARLGTFRIGDGIIAKLGQGQAFNPPTAIAGVAQDKLGLTALLLAAVGIGLAACVLAYHRHARARLPTVPR